MAENSMVIQNGSPAPDFTLKDHEGKEFKLSALRGKRVLLSFHPLAWTDVCAKQMQSLEANKDTFESLNTVAVGLSVDSVPCKKAWADSLGITRTSLLADFWPHGGVAIQYGMFIDKAGIDRRANLLVDEDGKVRFSKVYDINALPNIQEIIGLIKGL